MASATKMDIISNPLSAPFEAVREASLGGPLAYDKAGNPPADATRSYSTELHAQHIASILVTAALDRIRSLGEVIPATCRDVEGAPGSAIGAH